ncbi:hypothetical protein GW17_00000252 [Ensete ventricosum]|nr:hypothetical protein GW17_00000252 [Ensete ventricosum]RZR88791.1 hypothetical protein BHM03_00016418 [Ensete ventricosum]
MANILEAMKVLEYARATRLIAASFASSKNVTAHRRRSSGCWQSLGGQPCAAVATYRGSHTQLTIAEAPSTPRVKAVAALRAKVVAADGGGRPSVKAAA